MRLRAATVHVMHDWLRMIWWFCPVGLLWCALVRHLSIEWRLNPQYTYAWAVPVLCLWVAWAELRRLRKGEPEPARPRGRVGWRIGAALLVGIAYIPTRIIEEANPDWRLVSWVLAAEVIALTLLLGSVALAIRPSPAPVLLFFTAVPWPTCVERPLIQGLSAAITVCASEILGLAGLPCLSHGHVIEVGAGRVGIEEACSGIRSLQASCMLALVFGVLYHLPKRRLLLCLSGAVALSFLSNLLRTVSLTTMAARCGIEFMLRWHELTGTVTALVCFSCVWLLTAWLRNPRGSGNRPAIRPDPSDRLIPVATLIKPLGVSMKVATVLVALVAGAELATSVWYGFRERDLPPAVTWRIKPPREQAQFRELGMSDEARRLLRYDEGVNLGWTDDHGLDWQAIFLRWNPGGAAGRLARNHTPGDCLAAAGAQPLTEGGQQVIAVQGLQLPVRTYVARTERGLARIYYCLWEDRSSIRSFAPAYSTYAARLAAVRAGVRNSGQRSLELAVWNAVSEKESEEALQRVLTTIIDTQR